MSFVRQNLLSGTLSATLGSGATSMSSAELAALAAIAAPGRARLVLDPQGANGTPEIIDVTAHDADATVATIARAVEDATRFPAREHAEGTAWHLADTVETLDFAAMGVTVVDSPAPAPRPDGAKTVLWLDDSTNAAAGDWRVQGGQEHLFVAVGVPSQLATSPDGIAWTQQNSSFETAVILDVTWSPELGLFVAVAFSGQLATSPDGINWTQRTSSFGTTTIFGVTWSPELGLFVAVGNSGQLATSPDGENWTQQTSSFGTTTILGATWSPGLGLFVAVGESGKLATSPDGIAWTQQDSSFEATTIYGVTWSPELGLFVAVGSSGQLATSPDGENWTQQDSSVGDAIIFGATWSPELGLFVAVGSSGQLATSPDGVNWTQQESSFGVTAIQSVTSRPSIPPTLEVFDGTSWQPLTGPLADVATTTLTTDGDLLTRDSGVPARITRADLAADPAFTGRFAPFVPMRPGAYRAPAIYGAFETGRVPGEGRMILIPIETDGSNIDRIGCRVTGTAGSSGCVVRLGLYLPDGSDMMPGSLLVDAGAVAVEAAHFSPAITIDEASPFGLVWAAFVVQGGATTRPTFLTIQGSSPYVASGMFAANSAYHTAEGAVTGALPDPCPAIGVWGSDVFSLFAPMVAVRAVP